MKMLLLSISLFFLFSCMFMIVGGKAMEALAENAKEASSGESIDESAAAAQKEWREYLSRTHKKGENASGLQKKLEEICQDRGTYTIGGSGNRIIYYAIDDVTEICIVVDILNNIQYIEVSQRGVFVKRPDGSVRSFSLPISKRFGK